MILLKSRQNGKKDGYGALGWSSGRIEWGNIATLGYYSADPVLDRVAEVRGRRVGPLVVVDHKDHGQLPNAREVHPLVCVAALHRAFA